MIEGATENTAVVQALLDNLVGRGLEAAVCRLFIIDGAKALSKAIRNTFGRYTPIQRCQVHKARNITERLAKPLHASVRKALRQAWELDDADKAERLIKNLARRLEHDAPGVSASILEGLDEILTVTRLGLPVELRRSLACTNIIENMNGTIRQVCRNVKRWRDAKMALRNLSTTLRHRRFLFRAPRKIPAVFPDRIESGISDVWIGGTSHGPEGFLGDIAQRYAGLDAKNDPLARIDEVVPWEDFRPRLEAAWRKPTEERKSPAGRKPWDAVVMFKAIVLCELYNLSDDQVEYQLRDRLSFMRFLGLGLEDKIPDAKTVWLYREQLAQAGVIETLFEDFDGYLEQQGYLAMGGQIIDASIVPVPKQRNSGLTTTRGSRKARHPRAGRTSRPSVPRRIRTRVGPRSTARAITATRTTSTWTAGTSWCGVTK